MGIPIPVVDSLIGLGSKLVERLFDDPNQQAQAKLELLKLTQEGYFRELDADVQIQMQQMEVNKIEASSTSLFKSGWRPGAGWICVSSFAYNFLIGPVSAQWFGQPFTPLNMAEMLPVMFGLLGLGTLRTKERLEGRV